ncbi:hypothetical protein CBR_g31487 [Chara braunii]|uniref:CCHC-type domain-containing protein n=1 Tax=Chara braunii TaxID=69332 RepID=A0A388LF60_CHABU|nr:hypothetical protein CBR_g31487 [Chara braunii]|eukprot:GBG80931.1 hypothetical protein CBR_g31487 [Chara braunii]
MYTNGGNNSGNMNAGGMSGNDNNRNWGGRQGGPVCYECGKTGHIARDCWSKRGKPVQHEDEIHVFVRDLMKEKEEKRKREEEEERQRAKEEKERKRELDMARRTEEIRMQLQAEIAEKWRRQQEEVAEKTRGTKMEVKCTSPNISPDSKTAMKTKERKKKAKKSTRKQKGKKRILASSSSSSESGEESSESTSEDSSDTKGEALRLVKLLREKKQKAKSSCKQTKKKDTRRTPMRTYEKGESSKRATMPGSPTRTGGLESRTPLSVGYKGVSAGCSQEGFVDYTFAVLKQYSTKKVPDLREMCDKYGIKVTLLLGLAGEIKWMDTYIDKLEVSEDTLYLKTGGTYIIMSPWSKRAYVGYTARPIIQRWKQHVLAARSKSLGKSPQLYRWMRQFGIDNFVIIPIRHTTEADDYAFERHLIRDLSSSLNTLGTRAREARRSRRRKGRRERKNRGDKKGGRRVVKFVTNDGPRTSLLNWLDELQEKKIGPCEVEIVAGTSWGDDWKTIVSKFLVRTTPILMERRSPDDPRLDIGGANITEFLIAYENLAALLKWSEEEKMNHLGQHVSLSLGRDIMAIVAASRSWKETRDVMMRKYVVAEKMATEAKLAAVQRKNFATYNDFLREFTLVALRIPGVTDRIMSKYFLRQFFEFDKDKILSAYQQTSKSVNTRDADFSTVTDLAEKTVVTESLALLKEEEVIDLSGSGKKP